LASIRELIDFDWQAAEEEYVRAIELNDNSAVTHQDYAMFLVSQGRFDEGLREAQRSQDLDPLSAYVLSTYCMDFMMARHYDQVYWKCQQALEFDPQYYHAWCHLAQIDESTGNYDRSFAEFEKCASALGEPATRLAAMEQAFRHGGITALWRKQLEFSRELNIGYKDRYYDVEDAYQLASLYSLLKTDPAFDNMRSDTRFVAIVRIANFK
jgi:tetratricopeptide (TPR) repeat protein